MYQILGTRVPSTRTSTRTPRSNPLNTFSLSCSVRSVSHLGSHSERLSDVCHFQNNAMGNSRGGIKHKRNYKPTKRKANCRGIKKTLAKQARDPTVAQNWDNNKTLKQNYQSMGIDMLDARAGRRKAERHAKVAGLLADNPGMGLPADPDATEPRPKSANMFFSKDESHFPYRAVKFLSMQEAHIIREMLEKHGNDYASMASDLKLNQQQLTAGQLRKKCEKFVKEVQAQQPAADDMPVE